MNFFRKLFGQKETPAPASPFAEYRRELDKRGLRTRADLENLAAPLLRDATRIEVKKPSAPPRQPQLISHFGGLPYFEAGESWPQSRNGNDLDFVCQIVNTGNNNLPAEVALVQFYYDFELYPWDTQDDGWLVKIYPHTDPAKMIQIHNPLPESTVKYCEMEFDPVKSLPDWEGINLHGETAARLSCILDEETPWGPYLEVAAQLTHGHGMTSQIAGYPTWIQGESTPKSSGGDPMRLLFQLDSEENAGLMWGDCGFIYVFYDPNDWTHPEFVLQCT